MIQENNISDSRRCEFTATLNPVYRNIYRFIRALVRNKEDALDLLQDTLLIAYQEFGSLQNKDAFLSWLFTIAIRKHRRNERKKLLFNLVGFLPLQSTQVTSPDVDSDVQELYDALSQLPLKSKEAIILCEINGLSHKEIQEIQGGSLSGVKSRIARGKKQLLQILRNDVFIQTCQEVEHIQESAIQ